MAKTKFWQRWAAIGILIQNITLGHCLEVSYKVKPMGPTVWPNNSTPRYLPQKNGNTCPYNELYGNVYSSFIHNSPKLETTKYSARRERLNNYNKYILNVFFQQYKQLQTTQSKMI